MEIKEYINKRDNKKYYMFSVYLGVDIYTGREKRTTRRGFKTKTQAIREYEKIRVLQIEKTTNAYFNDLLLKWFENYSKTLKEGTIRSRSFYVGQILKAFEGVKLNKINTNVLQNYIDSLDRNIKNIATVLKLFFDYAFNNAIIKVNYFKNVVIPKKSSIKNSKDKYLTKDELIKFFECVENKNDLVLFRVMAFTGARIGEVLALTWEDIDFLNKKINIYKTVATNKENEIIINNTKNGVNREISIDGVTLTLLKELKNNNRNNDYIFKNKYGRIYKISTIISKIKAICKKNGLKNISCHTFRHTHATLLYLNGANVKDIQNRLGHTNINTTLSIYTHILEDKKVINNFCDYVGI